MLPVFKYHPDPLATGSIVVSANTCVCCGVARGYAYEGPVFSERDDEGSICPWCLADGSAHEKLGASFTDEAGVGGYGSWDTVSDDVRSEIAYRTPGFFGWQQERWWTHCQDGAQFLGRAGRAELQAFGPQATQAIQDDTGLPDGVTWDRFLSALDKDRSPTAYLFRCRACGQLGGYQDCN
jgi:uncharacterized protein